MILKQVHCREVLEAMGKGISVVLPHRSLMETHDKYLGMDSNAIPTSSSSDSTFLNPGAACSEDGIDRAPSPQPFLDPPFSNPMAVERLATGSPRSGKKKMRPHSEMMDQGAGLSADGKSFLIRRSE